MLHWYLLGAFEDADVIHVDGEVDPVRDLGVISEELRLKDEETLLKALDKLERTCIRGTDKKSKPEYVSIVNIFNKVSYNKLCLHCILISTLITKSLTSNWAWFPFSHLLKCI